MVGHKLDKCFKNRFSQLNPLNFINYFLVISFIFYCERIESSGFQWHRAVDFSGMMQIHCAPILKSEGVLVKTN